MTGTPRTWSVLTVGLAGGFFVASLASPRTSGLRSSVDNVAGMDNGVSLAPTDPIELPAAATKSATNDRLEALPKLTPQEVARRSLRWTASIRGDGVYGAGIVIDTRGYVLTNHHVIAGIEKIKVAFVDTEDMPATVVDSDKELDLALLKVDMTRDVSAPPAPVLAQQVGDDVFAVGCPRKMNFTVSRGMVSYIGRKIDGRYYIQSDLPTNDGNSGGPVVNERGEVIGVMTFILRDSQGLAFAVPIEYAYERFADVLRSDRVDISRFQRWRTERDQATASR